MLGDNNLLTTQYRRNDVDQIFTGLDMKSNTDQVANIRLRCLHCAYCLPCIYHCTHTELFVPAGHVGLLMDEQNRYLFAQPGMHNIKSCFTRVTSPPVHLRNVIKHGNRTIVIVEQGYIGYVECSCTSCIKQALIFLYIYPFFLFLFSKITVILLCFK